MIAYVRISTSRQAVALILVSALTLLDGCHSQPESTSLPAESQASTPPPSGHSPVIPAGRLKPIPAALQPAISFRQRITPKPTDLDVKPQPSSTPPPLASAFSAKTSKISAKGLYTFGGGIWAGKNNGSWSVSTTPNPTAVTDIGQTINGISMGITSVVLAASIRMMVGIGMFGFNTGVFADILFNGTILRGSDATTFACRQGTVAAYLKFGIGYSLAKVFVEAINAVLALFTSYRLSAQGDIISSKMTRLFHGDTQIPAKCATPKGSGSQG